jgi:hypothetical protein
MQQSMVFVNPIQQKIPAAPVTKKNAGIGVTCPYRAIF